MGIKMTTFGKRIDNDGELLNTHLFDMGAVRTSVGVYDFTTRTGAIGSYNLKNAYNLNEDLVLPAGVILIDAVSFVETAFTGTSLEIALTSGVGAGDIRAAGTIGSGDYATQYNLVSTKLNLLATANTVDKNIVHIRCASDATPALVISAAVATAGKVRVVFTYLLP